MTEILQAFVLYGAIDGLYTQMGGSGSWLGFPTSDEYDWNGGRRQNFEGGYIFWDRTAAAAFHNRPSGDQYQSASSVHQVAFVTCVVRDIEESLLGPNDDPSTHNYVELTVPRDAADGSYRLTTTLGFAQQLASISTPLQILNPTGDTKVVRMGLKCRVVSAMSSDNRSQIGNPNAWTLVYRFNLQQ